MSVEACEEAMISSLMSARYQIRQEALNRIGFATYADYLKSDTWSRIKASVIARDKACRICGNEPYTAHHVSYADRVMRGDDLTQLIAICRGCHRHIEFDGDHKLKSTTKINAKSERRSIKKRGGKATKKSRKESRPRCRICLEQKRRLGRSDVCLDCYRSGKATAPSTS